MDVFTYALLALSPFAEDPRDRLKPNFIDATSTLGALLLTGVALVATLETTKFAATLSSYDDGFSTRAVLLSTVAAISWGFVTSVLLGVSGLFVGGSRRMSSNPGVQRADGNGNSCWIALHGFQKTVKVSLGDRLLPCVVPGGTTRPFSPNASENVRQGLPVLHRDAMNWKGGVRWNRKW